MSINNNENLNTAKIIQDIKHPIKISNSIIELIKIKIDTKQNIDEIRDYINELSYNLYLTENSLNDYYDLSIYDKNYIYNNLVNFDIVMLLKKIILNVTPTIKSRNIEFSFYCNYNYKNVFTNKHFLERVLYNILLRTIRYCDSATELSINAFIFDKTERVKFYVIHNGIVLDEVTHSNTMNAEIINEFVRNLGGHITLYSTGIGVSYAIEIPFSTTPTILPR